MLSAVRRHPPCPLTLPALTHVSRPLPDAPRAAAARTRQAASSAPPLPRRPPPPPLLSDATRAFVADCAAALRSCAPGKACLLLGGRALLSPQSSAGDNNGNDALFAAGRVAAACGAALLCPNGFARADRGFGRPHLRRVPYFPKARRDGPSPPTLSPSSLLYSDTQRLMMQPRAGSWLCLKPPLPATTILIEQTLTFTS